jgi:hypothetical protein
VTGPYALLAKVFALLIALGAATWYGWHLRAQIDAGKLAQMMAEQARAIANEVAKARGRELEAESSESHTRYAYEAKLQAQIARTADANDTIARLRDAIPLYIGRPSVPATPGVPVSDSAPIAASFTGMADFGRRAATAADACAARLAACEGWAGTVITETSR